MPRRYNEPLAPKASPFHPPPPREPPPPPTIADGGTLPPPHCVTRFYLHRQAGHLLDFSLTLASTNPPFSATRNPQPKSQTLTLILNPRSTEVPPFTFIPFLYSTFFFIRIFQRFFTTSERYFFLYSTFFNAFLLHRKDFHI
jgi:hypothetical protein